MEKFRSKLGSGVIAISLAACTVGGAIPAFAANTGTTDVTVKTDEASTQLEFSVPTEIAFAASADGTLTGPSATSTEIQNKSTFPIHVTKQQTTAVDPFNIVSDVNATSVTTDNNIQYTTTVGTTATTAADSVSGVDLSAKADYNMGYAGSSTDKLQVATSNGKISKVTTDLTTAKKAAQITWTLAAGNAA